MLKRVINEVKKYEYKLDLLWLILFPMFNVIYFITNHIHKEGFDLTIALDRMIPFVPIFIIPYVYWYLYMIIGFLILSLNDRKKYMRCILGLYLGMFFSYTIYLIFPTEIVRPTVTGNGILNSIVKIIYSLDRPFNCFPSLHVLGTYFIMRYTKKENSKYVYYYTQVVGILIILSTIFIKQHFVLDAVASMLIVELINIIVKKISEENLEKYLKIPYEIVERLTHKSQKFSGVSSNEKE